MNYEIIKSELESVCTEDRKAALSRFFKTGKGEYGEGDLFLGVMVPVQKEIVKKYKLIELSEIEKLLHNPYHECRMTALQFLVNMYKKKKDAVTRKQIYDFYLSNTHFINNWDLVDMTCHEILGSYLFDKDRLPLYELAKSGYLWEERMAIVSTWHFIKAKQLEDTFAIAEILLQHPHDLIHKAVGWMLRETGKRDFDAEYQFLMDNNRFKAMPRTMLRYAIEKFPEEVRLQILKS